MKIFDFGTIALALLSLSVPASAANPKYSAVDIGSLTGGFTAPLAINDAGQVVGYSTVGDYEHAFLYSNATMIDLGTLGGTSSIASSLNASGSVVGNSKVTGFNHPFLYSSGLLTDLGPSGFGNGGAAAINGTGQIAGAVDTVTGFHAVIFNSGTLADLGTLGGSNSAASGLNDLGQVVGYSQIAGDTQFHGFLYSGTMVDLGTLGGTFSQATAVNSVGQVVGTASVAGDLERHIFLYSNGTMQDLGHLGVGDSNVGWAINASGAIVGESSGVAFLYDHGALTDLNTLVHLDTTLRSSHGINGSGQIIALGANGHGYLLTPLPSVLGVSSSSTAVRLGQAVTISTTTPVPNADTCLFNWGDHTSNVFLAANGLCTATNVYTGAGVYTVTVTLSTPAGASVDGKFSNLAVYDPNGGSASGTGWLSPTKWEFTFNAAYPKGSALPTGMVKFSADGLKFDSTTFEWLAVYGGWAQLKGVGTVNGSPNTPFQLYVSDGKATGEVKVDRLRIKIGTPEAILFDNTPGASSDPVNFDWQPIAGGSITVHK